MKKRNSKGITLIALVITIIILLILAGISIAMLTGQNGLLTKANTAKTENVKKSAEEKVKVAVTGSLGEDGRLDLNELNTNLRQVEGLTDIFYNDTSIFADNKIEKLPIDVVVDGYTFIIDGNGNVNRKAAKPIVEYSLSTETQVAEGTEVTVTITATIGEGETITKITKQDEVIATNKGTASFPVKTNGVYTVVVEGSNGETETCKIIIANIGTTEIFSDIYTSTRTYTDSSNKTARIPEGFAVGISSTINKIDNGLVITDKIDGNHKSTGNEFVWVPVNNTADFKRVDGYASGDRQTLVSTGKVTEPYTSGSQEEKDLYTAMYNSVTNTSNKGFYIGRYEAGKENNKVVVKKNMPVYNKVRWSSSSYMTVLIGGAVELAKNFTNDKSYKGKVTSTLIYGIQWDATMQFFDNKYINGTPSTSSYVRNSTGRAWRNGVVHDTGVDMNSSASNKVKNIYDMAGNVKEWTMEANNTKERVYRGGYCSGDDSVFSSSIRESWLPYGGDETQRFPIGFICECLK